MPGFRICTGTRLAPKKTKKLDIRVFFRVVPEKVRVFKGVLKCFLIFLFGHRNLIFEDNFCHKMIALCHE